MDNLPKSFEKTEEQLPITNEGLSTLNEYKQTQCELKETELFKRFGLSDDEIKLYQDNENGTIEKYNKMEKSVLAERLKSIYDKLERNDNISDTEDKMETPSMRHPEKKFSEKFYAPDHPLNKVRELNKELFDHLNVDEMAPITKRRKLLRRLQRKFENIDKNLTIEKDENKEQHSCNGESSRSIEESRNPNSLWDLKEIPHNLKLENGNKNGEYSKADKIIGPKQKIMYTIRDNKIVRLVPDNESHNDYRHVNIIEPVNEAEQRLLEGTKLSIDEIRSMERFKNYEPGIPSKVLYLKNISNNASNEDITILFNQFIHDNGGPIEIRHMNGRLRGQAFAKFRSEDLAVQALESLNGTVVKGKPLIIEFSRNTNNLQNVVE